MARKILLADDSVTAQNMGRKILSDAGYEVITVNNGSAALKKIAEARPDLIVLDVYMPGYSGLEVCQRLKENPETSRMPVLLTVGKLEPFKPEEAKRVGADAFIVKPFEASELLSALSKLEDRIIPRAEPSKPGRFARAIAAVEEQSRSAEPADEDSGWKNRISFPPKNKPKVEDDAEVEPYAANAIANTKKSRAAETQAAPVAETDVPALPKDVTPEELAALAAAVAQVQAKHSSIGATGNQASEKTFEVAAPQPESQIEAPAASSPVVTFGDQRAEEEYKAEIERAAAAEAKSWEKVGGKAEAKPFSQVSQPVSQIDERKREEEARIEETRIAEQKLAEAKLEAARLEAEKLEAEKLEAARLEHARAEEAQLAEARIAEEKLAQEKLAEEKRAEEKRAEEKLAEARIAQERLAEERLAEERLAAKAAEETSYATASTPESAGADSGAPSHADLIAAVASLEPANGKGWDAALATAASAHSGHEDMPATMAAAAGAGSASTRSHWTAVPVALDRDEVSISLEREMEKAYAAMVAAESAPLAVATSAPAAEPLPEAVGSAAVAAPPISERVPEPPAPVEQTAAYAAVEPAIPVASSPSVSEPVISAPTVAEQADVAPVAPAPVAPHESVLAHALSAVANAVREAVGIAPHPSAAEATHSSESSKSAATPETATDFEEYARVLPEGHRPPYQAESASTAKPEESAAQSAPSETAAVETAAIEAAPAETISVPPTNIPEAKSETPAPATEPQTFAESSAHGSSAHESQSAAEPAPPAAESTVARSDTAVAGRGGIDMREPDAAAAWASWRQIRDNQKPSSAGSSKSKQQDDDDEEYPAPAAEPAAMAVAAGAEKTPEEAAPSSAHPDAIASIVDSVLADLRPKIVAEISKKLNEKK